MKRKLTINKGVTIQRVENEDDTDDYVVKSIGGFGLWQAAVIAMAALSRFIAMWSMMAVLFLTPKTNFKCETNMKGEAKTLFDDVSNNISMSSNFNVSVCYKDCLKYKYENDVFEHTIISEFELICDREYLASLTQTILMFGLLLGVSVFGWISDRFGRSKAIILSGFINIFFMIGCYFAQDYWTLTGLRFFTGFASGGVISVAPVFVMEIVGTKYREIAGIAVMTLDGLAEAILALVAYFSETWRMYSLILGILTIFVVAVIVFLPESPRWSIVHSEGNKALTLMTKAAKLNNLNLSGIKENIEKSIEALQKTNDNGDAPRLTYLDLFRTRKLAVTTVCSFYVWFTAGVTYFGINQYMTVLDVNTYIAVTIIGLIQIPCSLIALVATTKFKRKISTICSFITVGVTMLILVFLPEGHWSSFMLGVIGFLAGCVVFSIIYIYVTELYPTPMRNMGFSLSSAAAKLGAMVAPFIANTHPRWIASLIFAILPFTAIGFCLLLPETKGKRLKDTVEA